MNVEDVSVGVEGDRLLDRELDLSGSNMTLEAFSNWKVHLDWNPVVL